MSRAAVLWTGGKDCCLAYLEAEKLGYQIVYLVTFIPRDKQSNPTHQGQFRSHPLEHIQLQSKLMGLEHLVLDVYSPFRQGYEKAIEKLKKEYELETIVTGDIDEIVSHGPGNWIRDCSKYSKMNVETPLWKRDREELLFKILDYNMEVVLSCVKEPWFRSEIWLGEVMDKGMIQRLKEVVLETGLDLCGEQGEYHTLVLNAPMFQQKIKICSYSIIEDEGKRFLKIDSV